MMERKGVGIVVLLILLVSGWGLQAGRGGILKSIREFLGKKVAHSQVFIGAAKRNGWSYNACLSHGVATVVAVTALYVTPICATLGLAAGLATCKVALLSSGTALTGVACYQLCIEGKLSESKCP